MENAGQKITFVLGSMGRGGAEKVISIMSRSYAERGYQTDIILLLKNEVGYDLHPSTRIIDFSGKINSRIGRLPYWFIKLRGYFRESNPKAIVSFVASINVIVCLSIIGLNRRVIVSERNDPRHDGRSKILELLTKVFYPRVDKVVFQTKRAEKSFPKLKNAVIIPNPVNVNYYAAESVSNRIVSVGRLTDQKNHKLLIDAFAQVYEKHSDLRLDIYGEGDCREHLENYIASLNLEDCICLKGNVIDVHKQISTATMFCLSSNYEGLSNALLEAMMMGIPCVSTNCAGADEFIIDGENGYLVPVGNVDEMANAIQKLVESEETRKKFSKQSVETSKMFSVRRVMDMWDGVILGFVEKKR